MTQWRLPRLSLERAGDVTSGSGQLGVRGGFRFLAVPALVVGVLATLWAWSDLALLLVSVVKMLFLAAAVLTLVLWVARSRWGFVSQYRPGPRFPGILHPFAAGVFRQPPLALLGTLGLILISIVSSAFIVLAAGAAIAGFALIQLTAHAGVTTVRRRQQHRRLHGPDVRLVKAPRARPARAPEPRLPGPAAARRVDPPARDAEAPVEFLLVVSLPSQADPVAAARMAIHAVASITRSRGLPSPSCQQRSSANGRALLELRFHASDARRGQEHVLNEAKARIWDEFHAQGVTFAFVTNQPAAAAASLA